MRDCDENKIKLVLIRHAQTQSNLERRYCGSRTDEDICDEGRKKALGKKEEKVFPDVDLLFSSPKKRCLSTAEILYPGMIPEIIPEFDEIDFGDFTEKNFEELNDNPAYGRWIKSNGTLPFPNGESREDFIKRTMCGFEKMMELISERKEEKKCIRIGVITHGGSIMAILSSLCGGDYFDYQVGNVCGYECSISGKEGTGYLKITDRF